MKKYYVNKTLDTNGRNEVHTSDCFWLSITSNAEYLGEFNNAIDAVSYAKCNGYSSADGCRFCSSEAHTA